VKATLLRLHVLLCVALLCILLHSCAPTRFVKPLTAGTTAIGASVGGPLIKYSNVPIPTPLSSLVAGYGLRDDITAFAGVHTTALAYGVLQSDLGIVKKLYMQDGWLPAIVVSPVANVMMDRWEHKFSFFPQLDAHFYWHYRHKPNYFYLGMSNWVDFNTKRSLGDKQETHWLPTIQVGHRWITKRWDYITEVKYIAPGQSNQNIVVEYISPVNKGALGLYLGLVWKHEKKEKPAEVIEDIDEE
jgi:hypothetical protein